MDGPRAHLNQDRVSRHVRQQSSRAVEGAAHVDFEPLPPIPGLGFFERLESGEVSCISDQDVDLAKGSFHVVEGGADGVGVGDVALDYYDFGPGGRFFRCRFEWIGGLRACGLLLNNISHVTCSGIVRRSHSPMRATLAPALAKPSAVALPIDPPAPVMATTLFFWASCGCEGSIAG